MLDQHESASMTRTGEAHRRARAALTILIPCFNERHTVLEVIERVRALPIDKLVIVVDNCSTDGTRELLRAACSAECGPALASPSLERVAATREVLFGDGFVAVLQPENRRKGASVRLGIELAQSDYFVCQDADFEYDPADLLRLLEHARSTGAVAVFGSRLSGAAPRGRARLDPFQLGRVGLTRLFRRLFRSSITDVATCYKLIRSDVAQDLELETEGFELDFEIPARLRARGHEILELPVSFTPRTHAQGKKIRWRDGVTAAWVLLRLWWRLSRRARARAAPPGGSLLQALIRHSTKLF
jgi:glycosyltransferase involved in cell wall biosynthesis